MFGSSTFLDADVEAFHLKCWSWLLRCTGGIEELSKAELVLPTKDFFPPTDAEGHQKALHIFECVRKHSGMLDWPVELVAQQERARRVATFGVVQNEGVPAGTFAPAGNQARITYEPAHLIEPQTLIATLAHELGHYLNHSFPEGPPGGWDLEEPATDITAAFFGFGIFSANSAFHFTQTQDFDSQGYSTAKLGYITEAEWALNIAIFCILTETDVQIAKPHLKPHIWKQVRKVEKYLRKNDIAKEIISDGAR